jgi:hypothetical protein
MALEVNQPLGDAPARPIFARARRWFNFHRPNQAISLVNAQALVARLRRLCAGIVDADIASKGVAHAVSGTMFNPNAWETIHSQVSAVNPVLLGSVGWWMVFVRPLLQLPRPFPLGLYGSTRKSALLESEFRREI